MYAMSSTVKFKPGMLAKAMEMGKDLMESGKMEIPPGMLSVVTLINEKEEKIQKITIWESESAARAFMGKEDIKTKLAEYQPMLKGKIVMESYDNCIVLNFGDRPAEVL